MQRNGTLCRTCMYSFIVLDFDELYSALMLHE